MRNSEKTCLIVPCYNEEKRLDLEEFRKYFSQDLAFVFVNDGSTDKTIELLKKVEGTNVFVVDLEHNVGKAEAIRQGALYVMKSEELTDFSWVGYWDSDLSVPLYEIENFYNYRKHFAENADCVIGSRVKRMGSDIIRSAGRHYLGRSFCTVVSYLFSITYYDTQCGAKLFKRELLEQGFRESFTSKWVFDIELLLRLQEYNVTEYPLMTWQEKSGSKINFMTVWLEVVRDLLRMKKSMK